MIERTAVLAIDPGASGGIAFRDHEGAVYSMPMPKDNAKFVAIIAYVKENTGGHVAGYLERVSGYIGGEGHPGGAMFNFGMNYGFIRGVLTTLGIAHELILPKQWQSVLELESKSVIGKKGWKNYLKQCAQRRYPEQKVTLKNADALLLLNYGELDQEMQRKLMAESAKD